MDRDQIIAALRAEQAKLQTRGVTHAALFGSRARGDHRSDSDIDIMVEIDPEAHVTIYDFVGIQQHVAGLFDHPVDLVEKVGLKPRIAGDAVPTAIHAF